MDAKRKARIAEAILNRDVRLRIVPSVPLLKPSPPRRPQKVVTSKIVIGKDNKRYRHDCVMTVITESVIVIPPPFGRIREPRNGEIIPLCDNNNKDKVSKNHSVVKTVCKDVTDHKSEDADHKVYERVDHFTTMVTVSTRTVKTITELPSDASNLVLGINNLSIKRG